jgi:hypothetical protein
MCYQRQQSSTVKGERIFSQLRDVPWRYRPRAVCRILLPSAEYMQTASEPLPLAYGKRFLYQAKYLFRGVYRRMKG